jgi:hypothetical protein
MWRGLVILLLSFLSLQCSFGQVTIVGTLLNGDTKEPIAYANIGILNSNVGTTSNPDGSFSLLVPSQNLNDSLTFSALGFGKRELSVNQFFSRESYQVLLHEKPTVLQEVLIPEKKMKNKIYELGNRSVQGGVLETDTTYSGRSISLLIDKGEEEIEFPIYIEKATLRIFRNNLSSFKIRVRLNDIDPTTGEPGADLLQKSIVIESSMKNGWLEFDLSSLRHLVYKPFFVTFEQILDLKDRTAIADGYREFMRKHPEKLKVDTIVFDGKKQVRQIIKGSGIDLPGTFIAIAHSKSVEHTCYVRETSFGAWKKVRGIVTAYVTLSNQVAGGK